MTSARHRRGRRPVLHIRDTGRYGRGVYAGEAIAQGAVIHVLAGQTISLAEFVRRIRAGEEPLDDPLHVGLRTYLILDELSRSFNHSCEPNAGLRKRSELFAFRRIEAGEEVTFDYSTTVAPTEWSMACSCGSKACRGRIGDIRSIPDAVLNRYRNAGGATELHNGTDLDAGLAQRGAAEIRGGSSAGIKRDHGDQGLICV